MPELVYDLGVTAESSELTLNADLLRQLNDRLRPDAVAFESEIARALEITDATIAEMSVDIWLPTSMAGPAGKALRAVDVAWRLAYVLSEADENQLDRSGEVSLDDLAPVEEYGLVIAAVELASFRGKLKYVDAKIRRIGPWIAILSSATTIATNVDRAIAGNRPQTPSCRVEMTGNLREPLPDVMRRELPGLPRGCSISANVTTPEGVHLHWQQSE